MAENDEAYEDWLGEWESFTLKNLRLTLNISVVELSEEFFNTFVKDYQIQIGKWSLKNFETFPHTKMITH